MAAPQPCSRQTGRRPPNRAVSSASASWHLARATSRATRRCSTAATDPGRGPMDGKMLARIGAIIFIAIAITATVIEMTREEEPARVRSAPALQPEADPLRLTLRRCQRLGEAATRDAACLSAWAEARDRFLGRSPAPAAPAVEGER